MVLVTLALLATVQLARRRYLSKPTGRHRVTFGKAAYDEGLSIGEVGDAASDNNAVYLAAEDDAFHTERRYILRVAP